jgi:hypothetical protein
MEALGGPGFPQLTLDEQDALWNQVKAAERQP